MNEKKVIIEEFSQKKGNLESAPPVSETVSEELLPAPQNSDQAVELAEGKLDVRKGGNIVIGTVNVIMRPIQKHFQDRQEKFYKVSKFHLAADIIFVLAILGLAALSFFLFNFHPKAQIDLRTSLASYEALSGQGETFTVQYKNNGKVDIKDSSLSFTFPKNLVLQKVSPDNAWSDQTNTFQIGDLPRGANGSVKIIGLPLGATGESQTLVYSLNYTQDNQRENTLGSFVFPLADSVLKTTFSAPKQIYQNIDFGGTITLKNTGRADIEKEINLIVDNSSVNLKSISSDNATLQNGAIIIDGLKAGTEADIEYEAVSSASEGDIQATLSTYLNLDGQRLKQNEVKAASRITAVKFPVELTANKEAINSGDIVGFKLDFTNNESSEVDNVVIDVTSADNNAAIKGFVLKNASDGITYKVTGNSIALLNTFKPGEKGELNFEAILDRLTVTVNQEAGIIANISYQVGGKSVGYRMFSPKVKFISAIQISSKGLYYSAQGDQLGVGPLPPAVDVPTTYWIFWEINNSGNELKNFTMTADLPFNVSWTGRKTVLAGDVRYGEASHKVVWTINDIPADNGTYRVGFEVQLIPTAADIGKTVNLVANTEYSATDTFASQPVKGSLVDINTDLKDDPTVSGKGRVVEIKIVK
jgi:hypothetical protein